MTERLFAGNSSQGTTPDSKLWGIPQTYEECLEKMKANGYAKYAESTCGAFFGKSPKNSD